MASRAAVNEIERIAREVAGYTAGVVAVRSAEGELSTDREGEAVLRFTLRVSDPPDESGTWPLEDVQSIRHHVQGLVANVEDDFPYVLVQLQPETPDPPEGDEDTDEDLARALDQR